MQNYKPVVAIEYIYDNYIVVYYTDGQTLVGPKKATGISDFKENQLVLNYVSFIDPDVTLGAKIIKENQLVLNYVSFIDPDNPFAIYHITLGAKIFDTKEDFDKALKTFVFHYKQIYNDTMEKFPLELHRPGVGPIKWDSVPIVKIRESIFGY